MTNTKRAPKGGAYGANGEWYEGGRFINTIPENNKALGSKPIKPRKVQIEPYVWVVTDRKPIFQLVGTVIQWEDRYDRDNKRVKPSSPEILKQFDSVYYSKTVQQLCDMYNSGERYMN